ncbi:MAG: hypothetical protein D6729_02055 [Deltaproteobacteria bacterium]|nr:MAG: hypothetical protein D6729_02055 [Deltaproteobacteria bacterium]
MPGPVIDDPFLKKRPAAAELRLGPRPVRLLALGDVLARLEGAPAVLLTVWVDTPILVPPVLRAARDCDAVVGFAPARVAEGPRALHAFFESICGAAESLGWTRPLWIRAPTVTLERPEDADLAAERMHTYVEAGFTAFTLRVAGLEPEAAAPAVREATEPVRERELGLEIEVDDGGEADAGRLVAALKLLGAAPDLVGVVGGEGAGLAELASEVDPVGVAWHQDPCSLVWREGLRSAVGAGARLLSLRSPLADALVAALPPPLSEEMGARLGTRPPAEVFAEYGERLSDLEGDALDRVEVRVYNETEDLLRLLKLAGTAGRLRAQLLEEL